MSSTLNPVTPSEVQTDKLAVETSAVDQQASNQTGSLNSQSNDTNSTAQNEVSPLKRDHSESAAASDEQTPARKKSKRIDKFKEESEALLRSYGLKEGTDSEKRLTRSRTRGTPVSTPVAKPEPRKATTGAKRGRKPAEKKDAEATEPVDDEPVEVKETPQKGRAGRVARQSEEVDTAAVNDEPAAESELVANVGGDSLEKEAEHKVSEETTKAEVVEAKPIAAPAESKPTPAAQEISKEIPKVIVTEKPKPPAPVTTNDSKPPVKTETSCPAIPKEQSCKKDEPSCKLVEKPKEPAHSIPTLSVPPSEPAKEKPVEPVAPSKESKVENNNLPPTLKPVSSLVANEQPIKAVPVEPVHPVESSKLENDSTPEKKEVQTA